MCIDKALTSPFRSLEAATSRLEDMASATIEAPKTNVTPAPAAPPAPTAPLAAAVVQPPKPKAEPLPESVEDFDAFVNTSVKKYGDLSNELGGPIAKQVGDSGLIQVHGS